MEKKTSQHKIIPERTSEGLKSNKPAKNSVGAKAIKSSLLHAQKYMVKDQAIKLSLKMNQKGGFDCPGCAWPDPDDDRSKLGEYCENGIKAIAEEATNKSIKDSFFVENSIDELLQWTDFELGKQGRLTRPYILKKGSAHYTPIKWKKAFSLIANELNALADPDDAIFYTSGRTSNEAAYLYQLFARSFGTNNLPDCSNMCHESSGVALSETLGIGKGSVKLEDFEKTELVIVMGQNPGTNHPRMLSALEKSKENGAKIISINPLPEAGLVKYTNPQSPFRMLTGGIKLTDLHLPVKLNGDVALLKAIMILLLEKEKKSPGSIFDLEFIEKHTSYYQEFINDLKSYDLEDCIRESGIIKKNIEKAVELIASRKKIIICWAMGLTQHRNGVNNIREVVNLLLLKGSIGIEGGGTCPVRGHSNVQGDRTMGIWEAAPQAFIDRLSTRYNFQFKSDHGLATVSAIKAMHEQRGKVFFGLGGNFVSASPDTEYTATALSNCRLTVHVSTKLNRSHLVHGEIALILPCLGRTDKDIQSDKEQFVSCENSMGVVQSSQGILTPIAKTMKSEVEIICKLAMSTLPESHLNWKNWYSNYNLIRDEISAVIPGFEDYNKRVRQEAGFYLPNGAREGNFITSTHKAQFSINPIPDHNLKHNEFAMMTIRSHDQFNTTIYGLDDRYRGIKNGRRVILMNQEDMSKTGLKKYDLVDLESDFEGQKRKVKNFKVVPYPIPQQNVATYFPEANPLVPINSFAHRSLTPCSKYVVITIHKSE